MLSYISKMNDLIFQFVNLCLWALICRLFVSSPYSFSGHTCARTAEGAGRLAMLNHKSIRPSIRPSINHPKPIKLVMTKSECSASPASTLCWRRAVNKSALRTETSRFLIFAAPAGNVHFGDGGVVGCFFLKQCAALTSTTSASSLIFRLCVYLRVELHAACTLHTPGAHHRQQYVNTRDFQKRISNLNPVFKGNVMIFRVFLCQIVVNPMASALFSIIYMVCRFMVEIISLHTPYRISKTLMNWNNNNNKTDYKNRI